MSMANSLEVRVPFLDYRLVRLAEGIPTAWKQDAADFKILLKRALGKRFLRKFPSGVSSVLILRSANG